MIDMIEEYITEHKNGNQSKESTALITYTFCVSLETCYSSYTMHKIKLKENSLFIRITYSKYNPQ